MILVTGACGKTGKAVVGELMRRGAEVRAWVHRPNLTRASETIVGDMANAALWHTALVDCQKVYHICPNMSEDEALFGRNLLSAAKAQNIEHLVYHSVIHPQTEEMPHHWAKLRVEEAILASGIPFTIVQPTAYMQNLLAFWPSIHEDGVYRVPYSAESPISLVDLNDVAEVVTTVLLEDGHRGAIYELAGTHPLTQLDVCAALGENMAFEQIALADWRENAERSGLSEYAIETLSAMFRYYDAHGLVGNPTVLKALIGRNPTSLAEFVERHKPR